MLDRLSTKLDELAAEHCATKMDTVEEVSPPPSSSLHTLKNHTHIIFDALHPVIQASHRCSPHLFYLP
jgi:hypothetical protein